MEVNIANPQLQEEEISKKILDKISFNCPHCQREINETHLDEKGKYFQYIKEKIRRATEEEINYQRGIQKKQLLEQIKIERGYEKFDEVIKDKKIIEELKKTNENKDGVIEALRVKLSGAYESDKVENLVIVKDLRKKLEEKQKEVEGLKFKNQPEMQELQKNIEKLKTELSGAYSSDKVENLSRTQELKKELEESKRQIEKLKEVVAKSQSSGEVEKLDRVQKLVEKVDKLQNENQLLREHSRVNSKKKGELFEQYVSEELNWVFDNNKDKISKLTQTTKKADFIQEVLTENDKLAGRIIYEAKDTEKWDNGWIKKLESDMVEYKADFGIIVATCENGERPRRTDCRKRIYVTDENNFVNIAKALRHVLIQRQIYLEKTSSDSQEQRIKSFEEWISNRFPHFLSRLERELDDLNKNTISINRVAKNLSSLEDNIRKIVLEEMKTDLNNLVA